MKTSRRTPGTLLPLLLFLPLATVSCATTTTQMAPVAPERVEAEERVQREVLTELRKAQARLDDLTYPLLVAALPLCGEAAGPRIGFRYGSVHGYEDEWALAAARALGLTDTVTVASVADGSPAPRAGMKADDRIVSVAGVAVPPGPDGAVIVEGGINAYADGENVIIPWAIMRFANDDELRVIVAHEIAHNAMGHVDAKRQNAAWGALFGAIADVAMATQGVNTGAQYTAEFMQLGAQAYSQDFEQEADCVGCTSWPAPAWTSSRCRTSGATSPRSIPRP